jgi:threonylcarbamoyladenosine tRNA methylthiotransferase MtaB
VAMGCYPQEDSETLESMDEVDIIIGNQNKKDVLDYIESYSGTTENHVDDIMQYETFENFVIHDTLDKTRAFIKIQDGCDQYCSYCIIPYVRGKVRSKPYESIISEIKGLIANGFKEIVLTGIHVTKYGEDFDENVTLIDLLEEINTIEGLQRIRLSSLEPTFLTNKRIQRMGQLEKLCPHFHLSLQSGSDSVLYRMNRTYFDDPAITTDIIVGFPGETDLEFKETCAFVDAIGFSQVHVFKYSKRDHTVASEMDHQINGTISSKRSRILRDKVAKLQKNYDQSYLGTIQAVLFESYDAEHQTAEGLTKNYVRVKVNVDHDITSEIYSVKLQEYDTIVIGKIIEEV